MAATLEVRARKEGRIGILETHGYINDTEADRVAQAGHALTGILQVAVSDFKY